MLKRYASMTCVACGLSLALAGSVFADSVSVDTTGAGSTQTVVENNTTSVTTTNVNNVQVTNTNVQQASTGDVTADSNTVVGGATSGNASNNNSSATTVTIANVPTAGLPVGGGGATGGNGIGVSGGSVPVSASNPQGGRVLGASTAGGLGGAQAVLPMTGPTVPVDVSALRAAWHPQVQAPTAALVKGSRMFTTVMLVTATLLSILGALGSAWYARRREERV